MKKNDISIILIGSLTGGLVGLGGVVLGKKANQKLDAIIMILGRIEELVDNIDNEDFEFEGKMLKIERLALKDKISRKIVNNVSVEISKCIGCTNGYIKYIHCSKALTMLMDIYKHLATKDYGWFCN